MELNKPSMMVKLGLLKLAETLSTLHGLQRPDIVELNNLLSSLMQRIGLFDALVITFMMALVTHYIMIYWGAKVHPKFAYSFYAVFILGYCVVIVWNLFSINT